MTAKHRTQLATRHPVQGLLRFVLRFPLVLYRLHLGWLLGQRFLRLTHVGRKSGKRYRTMVEVVDHDPATDSYIVTSGWGEKSDWFRNIQKTPQVVINVGRRQLEVKAERLSADQAEQWLLNYARKHPRTFRDLARIMTGESLKGTSEDCRRLAEAVPVIAFRTNKKCPSLDS
jgi:deazaflavin-dependent oxidoreductase (nitroreductase family)